MRVVTKKEETTKFRDKANTRAMWKLMLRSLSYNGNSERKIVVPSSPSFFGLPLGQVAEAEDQLPMPVQVS